MEDLVPQEPATSSNVERPMQEDAGPDPKASRRRNAGRIQSVDDCLRGLSQLPGLLALRLLRPAESNAIKGAYSAILQHHQRSQPDRSAAPITDPDFLETLRTHPELLNALEPLLNDEQLQAILQQATKDGQA